MWYKFAKQGSVWSRIGSDAEAQFDALLDAATKTSGGDRKKYINIYELDKLFRKSKLKDMIIRFIKLQTDPGFLGAFQRSVFPNIEKLAFFEKIIPYFFANKIIDQRPFKSYADFIDKASKKGSGINSRAVSALNAIGGAAFDDNKRSGKEKDNYYEYLGIPTFNLHSLSNGLPFLISIDH